jgi:hypothetical protein
MKPTFEDRLQEFSEKHGAVLIGMHHELRNMVQRIECVEEHSAEAKELAKRVDGQVSDHISKLDAANVHQINAMDSLALGIRQQVANLEKSIKSQHVHAESLIAHGLALLEEQKERDINLKRREALLEQWEKRVVIGVTSFFVFVVLLIAYLVWSR